MSRPDVSILRVMRSVAALTIFAAWGPPALCQTVSVEAGLSYLPAFAEDRFSPAGRSEFHGFNLIGGTLLYNFGGPVPISTGIGARFGRKVLLDYHPSSPQPPGTGDASMSRKIRVLLVEIPILYRFSPARTLTIRAGGRVGHVSFNRLDHLLGSDFEAPANRVIISPCLDIAFCPVGQFQVIGGAEYRPMDIDYAPFISYSMHGISYCIAIGYQF